MTIEDPVEDQIRGINHIEISPKSGLTFARGLRTILRSDPDVLLVGEIRDEETARIAMQAGMTGHLVLTTVHAHNAASAIERLKDMGVEPGLLASAVNCIVASASRGASARTAASPTGRATRSSRRSACWTEGPGLPPSRQGLRTCGGSGYSGRVALYEVLPVTGEIRNLVGASTDEIFEAAVRGGMTTLRQDGVRLCVEGVSSLEEIRRVTGDRG
jgi:type II secretory ATPase GspE/PulE/Tfp pilus assembly ATPase PilB-like protein